MKADGKYIVLEFSEALQGDLEPEKFIVRAPVTDVTTWVETDIPIVSVEWYGGRDKIRLTLGDTNQTSLQGVGTPVKVIYRGGALRGVNGPLLGFSVTFTPDGVPYRGNQIPQEHVELSGADYALTVTEITHSYVKSDNEHVELSGASYELTLTHVQDL